MIGMDKTEYRCLSCKKAVYDYKPEYCCSGVDCNCKGQPLYKCFCSEECYEFYYESRMKKEEK
mgnify:CR=1 FL=1